MRILVFYYASVDLTDSARKTVQHHLRCFDKGKNLEVYYYNVGLSGGIHTFLNQIEFDIIVYNYTFTGLKWTKQFWFMINNALPILHQLKGHQIAIPQDEYVHTDFINHFFKEAGVKTVFTCFFEKDWQKAYPFALSGVEHFQTVCTGYVEESEIPKLEKFSKPHAERSIDIGYRARKNPYWVGFFGLRKWQISEQFLSRKGKSGLKMDISNDYKDVFYGEAWYQFLANCRVFIGTEGGASMLDTDGSIRERVDKYMAENPHATFEECEKACFEGLDRTIELYAISPRHFEACMTKTCQVLVEGYYNGILEANKHYIPLKADWSNIDEVLEKIKDINYCEQIAENAYRDIVLSGKYGYTQFVEQVINHVKKVEPPKPKQDTLKTKLLLKLIQIREKYPKTWVKIYDFYRFKILGLNSLELDKNR